MQGKGLRINMGKTKVLISGMGFGVLQKSSKDLFASRVSAQTPFSVVVVPFRSIRNAVVSLAL